MSLQTTITAHRDAAATARFKAREAREDANNEHLAAMYDYVALLHGALAEQPDRRTELAPELRDLSNRIDAEEARAFRASVKRAGA